MAWIRVIDDFINLDLVALVNVVETPTFTRFEFCGYYGQLIVAYHVSKEDAEKLMKVIQYATKAIPVHVRAPDYHREKIETPMEE